MVISGRDPQVGRSSPIRRIAGRETGSSQHHGGPIVPSQHCIVIRASRGAHNWAPIVPKDASISDVFFSGPVMRCSGV